jgi:hypothetical protein
MRPALTIEERRVSRGAKREAGMIMRVSGNKRSPLQCQSSRLVHQGPVVGGGVVQGISERS